MFEAQVGKYIISLDTDSKRFGGFGRQDDNLEHFTLSRDGKNWLSLYLPARSGFVLKYED